MDALFAGRPGEANGLLWAYGIVCAGFVAIFVLLAAVTIVYYCRNRR